MKTAEALEKVRWFLSQPLDTHHPEELKLQLAQAESWQAEISRLYRESKEELEVARNRMLLPKHKDYTDMDRTIRLESDTALIQRETDELKDLLTILSSRLTLGQSFLAG